MRFGVMAAGGVGGYFGGLLARAGEDVRFIARGPHLEAIRRNGLRVEAVVPEGGFTVESPSAAADPAQAGVCDVVLFCVKTVSNPEAIPAIAPMVGPGTVIISLQNGVDNEEQLAARYSGCVMGGAAYIFTSVAGPGLIRQIGGPRRLVFGELGGGRSPRGERILAALRRAEINAELSPDIEAELWTKFIFICAVGGVTALTRSPLAEIMAYEGTRRMMREVMREVYHVGRARGVRLPPGADEDRYRFLDQQNPASKGSLCHDLEAGRRLEIDALCGAAARLGREAGVPTPLNDFIHHTLKLADLQIAGEVKLER
ncbi:MAG: 2-dehydropantoate 2-reductase [Nitrospinota bacterium]